jgi:hypothetical protein
MEHYVLEDMNRKWYRIRIGDLQAAEFVATSNAALSFKTEQLAVPHVALCLR